MSLISLNLNHPPIEKRGGNPLENPSVSLGNLGAIWSFISGSEPTASGEVIDETIALQIITVNSCVRLIAEAIASMPLILYKRLPKGREEALDNPLHDLLTIAPNPEMSGPVFWETMVGSMALTGNSYAYVQRVGGDIDALWPLHPHKTRPMRLANNELVYSCWEGTNQANPKTYDAADILHFKLFSFDGLLGLSPIALSRQDLGIQRAATKMVGRFYANNGRPSAVMTPKEGYNPDDKMLLQVRESWQAANSGENSLKTAFVPGQWEYKAMGLNFEDIQLLDSRKYSRTEIAALFHVPSHLVGDTTRQSNTNSEQEGLSLVTYCLRPYLKKIEMEIQKSLLPTKGRTANKMCVEFDIRQLLRGDFKASMEGYQIGRNAGFFNANYILEDLGENPIGPVGDIYWMPVNYMNAENALDPNYVHPSNNPQPKAVDTTPKLIEAPKEKEPDGDERSILAKATTIGVVFKDSIGRLINRDKRDLDAITSVFTPCLRSITALSVDHFNKQMNTNWSDDKAESRIVNDICKSLEKRADNWKSEDIEAITSEEFRKALKSIAANVAREIGASTVTKE
jgi:HK97 family phage portal protein